MFNVCISLTFWCFMPAHLHYECVCVEITLHTFLTSALAGSKDEVTPVTNKGTQTISPQCTTEETYQPHTSTTSTPQDIFINPLHRILGRWTPEQISTQY